MAAKAGLSRASFRDVVGQTPNDYLTGWRVTVAQERLRAGDSVGRTGNALGYSSAAAFSRTFAQRPGQSPRQWATEAAR
ncbi:helix-turn-helix domain-containing protein [Streptomyces sp. NRRL S-813]|uniref:helix-turn-helix domain-containing protein n=1 Tax=Streptomyces sp. NRRL S-813 TaxID=1463919 RepID=UPI00099DF876|nr:helix-turn-helix domain-containing protein [Streptomyces sp. NRRL S-813]